MVKDQVGLTGQGAGMDIQEHNRKKAAEYRDYTALNLSKMVKVKSYSSKERTCAVSLSNCAARLDLTRCVSMVWVA
jgi:hypothetical protein